MMTRSMNCGVCNKNTMGSSTYNKCGICQKFYHNDYRKCGGHCPLCNGSTCKECAKPYTRTIKHIFHKNEVIRETLCVACINSQ
jgi:hypothetical protein